MSTSEPIALKVHIPKPSSSDGSNQSELTLSTYQSRSTTSLPVTANTSNPSSPRITFAPLPSVEPRKRRSTSNIKLGVSARSSMMSNRRSALKKLNDTEPDQPRKREDGTVKALPPSRRLWEDEDEDEEMAYPRARTRRERQADPDVPLVVMGRMMKNAWRRVSQAPNQTLQAAPPNQCVNGDNDRSEWDLDANKVSSENGRMEGIESKKQKQYTLEESAKTKQVSSAKEDEGLGAIANRNSGLKFKKPVLGRSASEPLGKVTTMFRGR